MMIWHQIDKGGGISSHAGGGAFGHDLFPEPLSLLPSVGWTGLSPRSATSMGVGGGGWGVAAQLQYRDPLPGQPRCFFFFHAEKGRRPHACQNSASATPNCPSFWQLPEPTPAVTSSLYLMINTYNNAAVRLTCTLGHLQLWNKLYFPSLFLLIAQERGGGGGQEKG